MKYDFYCEKCGNSKQIEAPIQEGPPSVIECSCGIAMRREYTTSFILKGDDWPGKKIKRENAREGDDSEIENFEAKMDNNRQKKELNDTVLKERRKGTQHMKKWRKKNKHQWDKYTKMRGGKK